VTAIAEPDRSEELAALLGRVALQDRRAFEELYRRTCDHLLGLAYGILGRADRAEDVLQEAFMNVWHSAAHYDPRLGAPMTWLINVVRNKAIDKLRGGVGERRHVVEFDATALEVPGSAEQEPQQLLEAGLLRSRIDGCMARLSPAQRQALALAYYRGMVHTEIAEALGTPLGTVKAWVRRGLDRLRDCLRAAGVEAA
jgi:RNA polymerase sigma-70 factor (ECF subfamily)